MKLTLLTAASAAAVLMAGAVQAQTTPAQVIQANQTIVAAIEQAKSGGGQPPTLANAETAATVRTAYDVNALDGAEASGIEALMPVCAGPAQSMMSYMLFGLSPSDLQGNPTEAVVLRMNQNSVRYQDEAALAMRFALRCNGVLLSKFNDLAAGWSDADKTPARRTGARQSRTGAVQIYTGVLMLAVEPTTRAANREVVLDEAVARANVFAGLMAPEQRRDIIARIDAMLPSVTNSTVRTRFGQIRTSMTRTDCGALCAM